MSNLQLFAFTFHYVSINTPPPLQQSQDTKTFTFHYVSINTKKSNEEIAKEVPLHSTMFLLIHRPRQQKQD